MIGIQTRQDKTRFGNPGKTWDFRQDALRARTGYAVLFIGKLCDIIQELEQVLELRLVTVIVIVIVSSSGEARWSLPNIR